MTFQTAPASELGCAVGSAKARSIVICRGMVATIVMAILTQSNLSFHQQCLMAAAMRTMADQTVLFHRRMLPNPWAALVSMTFVAELVVALGIDHVFCQSAVSVVAVGTFDLAFDYGMMRYLVGVGTDIFMAVEADLGLFYCGARGMDIVAGDTGHVILLVRTHIPEGKMLCFLVATQTLLAEFFGRTAVTFAKGDYCLLGWIVFMLVCCTMAGLAIVFALPDFCME